MSNKDEELEKILNEFKTEDIKASPEPKTENDEAKAAQAPKAEPAADAYAARAAHLSAQEDNLPEAYKQTEKREKGKSKIIIIVIAVVAVIAIACAAGFGLFSGGKEEEPSTDAPTEPPVITTEAPAPVSTNNPLTGEADYNAMAVGLRPIAVVVDNASGARPQYNLDAADIVVEGEVEGGETRMLWLFSDMTDLPELLGPTRSARPSYVQFSELFDAIFIHFGGSHSKGDYVGGYEVIAADNVDDIDGMKTSACFKRTSDKHSPHNAALLGNKLIDVIESKGYRTKMDQNSFADLSFNESVIPVSSTACSGATVKFSSRTRSHTFAYNEAEKVYTNQSDYGTPVRFTNVIVMFAQSEYIVKYDYKQQGKNETYLNYSLTSGTGKLLSCGTEVDFTWSVDNGKLSFKDTAGNQLDLNPGKSYLALVSSNNGGSVSVNAE
ncbi:MAG: DUF3048 domain-containing protein [Eubacterium sp.]|nr:DUF3048 domain-containing protein [Eubacterium sp.]